MNSPRSDTSSVTCSSAAMTANMPKSMAIEDGLKETNETDAIVLLCLAHSGKYFPTDPAPYTNALIVVSFVLDEDVLKLDPVPLRSAPVFDGQIAWEMPANIMQNLLAMNMSVEVKVTCVNADKPDESVLIGSVFIPLKSARFWSIEACQSTNGFLPLSHQSYSLRGGHMKLSKSPKLKTGLNVRARSAMDMLEKNELEIVSRNMKTPANQKKRTVDESIVSNDKTGENKAIKTCGGGISESFSQKIKLNPILKEEKGYFELEPHPTHLFQLCIQILYAKDLSKLIRCRDLLHESIFQYSFEFGWRINSDGFQNLDDPEFQADAYIFKIAGVPERVQSLFGGKAEPLRFSLMYQDDELAKAFLPLGVFNIRSVEQLLKDKFRYEDVVPFDFEGIKSGSSRNAPRVGYALELNFEKILEGDKGPVIFNDHAKNVSCWSKMAEEAVQEIEIWKLRQKESFKTQLRHIEEQTNEVFAAEWRKREEEREKSVREKYEEISKLGEELRKKMTNLISYDEKLKAREAQLDSREKILEEKKERQLAIDKSFQASVKKELSLFHDENKSLREELNAYKKLYEETRDKMAKMLVASKFSSDPSKNAPKRCDETLAPVVTLNSKKSFGNENQKPTDNLPPKTHSSSKINELATVKNTLLAAGYSRHDELVVRIDIEIKKLQENV